MRKKIRGKGYFGNYIIVRAGHNHRDTSFIHKYESESGVKNKYDTVLLGSRLSWIDTFNDFFCKHTERFRIETSTKNTKRGYDVCCKCGHAIDYDETPEEQKQYIKRKVSQLFAWNDVHDQFNEINAIKKQLQELQLKFDVKKYQYEDDYNEKWEEDKPIKNPYFE